MKCPTSNKVRVVAEKKQETGNKYKLFNDVYNKPWDHDVIKYCKLLKQTKSCSPSC